MLCITGCEKNVGALAARVQKISKGFPSSLMEIRLDALDRIDDEVFGLIRKNRGNMVVVCRPERQGGWFEGSEEERLKILSRLIQVGVKYLDVEADITEAALERMKKASSGGTKIVLSHHDFSSMPADIPGELKSIRSRGVDVVKMAVRVEDTAELSRLKSAGAGFKTPLVIIGMGAAGVASRIRYPGFGSIWTYVSADVSLATAPGQLSLDQALEMGLPQSATAPFLALVGGPQVVHSPGPVVYNRFFRARGLPYSYFWAITSKARETFELLKELGAIGLGVTMPHKAAAFEYGKADEEAGSAGAANTLRFSGEGVHCTNTDIQGVRGPLGAACGIAAGKCGNKKVLILGAGGAARAAVVACLSMGFKVTVSTKYPEEMAKLSGLEVSACPWDDIAKVDAEVLINATPVTGNSSPWPEDVPLKKEVVFDLAISGDPSRLLSRARREGAIALEAREMWLNQGARQIKWITGLDISVEEMRGFLPEGRQ